MTVLGTKGALGALLILQNWRDCLGVHDFWLADLLYMVQMCRMFSNCLLYSWILFT